MSRWRTICGTLQPPTIILGQVFTCDKHHHTQLVRFMTKNLCGQKQVHRVQENSQATHSSNRPASMLTMEESRTTTASPSILVTQMSLQVMFCVFKIFVGCWSLVVVGGGSGGDRCNWMVVSIADDKYSTTGLQAEEGGVEEWRSARHEELETSTLNVLQCRGHVVGIPGNNCRQ